MSLQGVFPFVRNGACGGSNCCLNPHPECWVGLYTHHRCCLASSTLHFNELQSFYVKDLYSVDWEPLGAPPQLDGVFRKIAEQDFIRGPLAISLRSSWIYKGVQLAKKMSLGLIHLVFSMSAQIMANEQADMDGLTHPASIDSCHVFKNQSKDAMMHVLKFAQRCTVSTYGVKANSTNSECELVRRYRNHIQKSYAHVVSYCSDTLLEASRKGLLMVSVDPVLALAVAIADASQEMQDLWLAHHMLSHTRPGFPWQFAGPCCDFFKVFEWLTEDKVFGDPLKEKANNSSAFLGSEPFLFLEIGVLRGSTALRALHRFPKLQYVGVDPMISRNPAAPNEDMDMFADSLARRIAAFGHGSELLRSTSEVAARNWKNAKCIDLIFIDGGHSIEDVFSDFTVWLPHVCNGGIMAGHDLTWGWGESMDYTVLANGRKQYGVAQVLSGLAMFLKRQAWAPLVNVGPQGLYWFQKNWTMRQT